jgi:signal transduction histidine kinase/DNA-binding response OmpR family regulator
MLPGFLRSARALLAASLILGSAAAVIAGTWYAADRTAKEQRLEALQRTNAAVSGLTANYSEQIARQILALDQSLDTMVQEWEGDPRRFNLENARARSKILNGISRDMFLADENGIIRQSSVSDFIGHNASDLEAFRQAAEHANDKPKLWLGGASVNPIMRQWHLDAVRILHHPDGSFAGIIDADYRVSAITDVFGAASPPGNGFAALISLTDGKMRATFGASGSGTAGGSPDSSIADTKMFAALDAGESGLWAGPSAFDAVTRIHAFRRLPGRDLAIITGIDEQDAFRQAVAWQWQARIFAGAVTFLTLVICVLLLIMLGAGRRRLVREREVQARFAASHALSEVARAQADAVARRLQATFAVVTDGVAIFDAHLNLVEWSGLFPERSGINASFVRTGMPMEEVLRMQAEDGHFGVAVNVEAEVERRAALLRAGNFGTSQNFQAGGRTIELRCRPLPEGGFVALYTDVTEARRARQALRSARDALTREQSARLRFLGAISHELRARVAMFMRSISRLQAMEVPASRTFQAIGDIRRVGETLASLATDAIEVPRMEGGTVALRPALIGVRPLVRDIVDMIQPAARDRGITVYSVVNEAAPEELIADPDRIRQIVTLLLSEAVRFAAPDTMWLLADGGADEHGEPAALRLTIRGFGTPILAAERDRVFPLLDAIAVPEQSTPGTGVYSPGTGLGPAIARYLTGLMGGQLRCEGWSTIDGRTGNDFILTLPQDVLPGQRGRAPGQAPAEGRPLPRTRVLLVGAPTGLRMAAVTMLRRDSHMADAVATGEEAVRALSESPYDIVFMDTFLPDMNLESVVATIRDTAGPTQNIPVIALAPPHDEADARAWRDLGMDDVLVEPPSLEDLTAAIGRHVWHSRSSFGSVLGVMPGLAEETEEGIPILAADRIAELRTNIKPNELQEMVEECIADLFHRLPALRRSLAVGAPGAILAQTHAMVGMAGGYGMAVLEARLRAILTAVRARRLDTIDGAAAVIEADLTHAAAALRRTLRMPQSARSDAQS